MKIVADRKVRFKDLLTDLATELRLDEEMLQKILNQLKEDELVEATGPNVNDFRIYYPTSNGIAAARGLSRLALR